MARYRNPWHQSLAGGDPAFYETDARPVEHAGHLLYQRIPGRRGCWDVVKDGVCIAQRCGLGGAKAAAEQNAARLAVKAEA